jgi:hypothetical protein
MEMEARGFQQAVKIAVAFPHISFDLAFTAYTVQYLLFAFK